MFARTAVILAACVAGYLALPQDRAPTDQSSLFANEAESLLYTPLSLSFTCEGRDYGYYADVDNNCQVNKWTSKKFDSTGRIIYA